MVLVFLSDVIMILDNRSHFYIYYLKNIVSLSIEEIIEVSIRSSIYYLLNMLDVSITFRGLLIE